jgi:hypothetical protein
MRKDIIVGVSSAREVFKLQCRENESGRFSVCGEVFHLSPREEIMEAVLERMTEDYIAELESTQLVRLRAPQDPEFTEDEAVDYDYIDCYWYEVAGEHWGAECVRAGRCVDAWEEYLSLYTPDGYPATEKDDILWFIPPYQYGAILRLWRDYHLQSYAIPDWVFTIHTPKMEAAIAVMLFHFGGDC